LDRLQVQFPPWIPAKLQPDNRTRSPPGSYCRGCVRGIERNTPGAAVQLQYAVPELSEFLRIRDQFSRAGSATRHWRRQLLGLRHKLDLWRRPDHIAKTRQRRLLLPRQLQLRQVDRRCVAVYGLGYRRLQRRTRPEKSPLG